MAVQIQYDVEGSTEVDAENNVTYVVTWTVTAVTDMPAEIFVHKFSTEVFDHVANAGDLVWPTSKDPQKAWYRLDTAVARYEDLDSAEAGKTQVATDIQALVDLFNAGLTAFLSTDSFTVDPT